MFGLPATNGGTAVLTLGSRALGNGRHTRMPVGLGIAGCIAMAAGKWKKATGGSRGRKNTIRWAGPFAACPSVNFHARPTSSKTSEHNC
jgi:hypothetical protein